MKEMKMKIIEHCVKSLFMIAVACFVAAASIETNKPTTTEWTVNIAERLSSFGGEQIGFRSDGVMVWRKANCATNYFFDPGDIRILQLKSNVLVATNAQTVWTMNAKKQPSN